MKLTTREHIIAINYAVACGFLLFNQIGLMLAFFSFGALWSLISWKYDKE